MDTPKAHYILMPDLDGKTYSDLDKAREGQYATGLTRGSQRRPKIYSTSDGGRSYIEVNDETESLVLPDMTDQQSQELIAGISRHYLRWHDRCACGAYVGPGARRFVGIPDGGFRLHLIEVAYGMGLVHAMERAHSTQIMVLSEEQIQDLKPRPEEES